MKYLLIIGMTLGIAAVWMFYNKPELEKFNYSITFPWKVENKNILDCSIEINSENSELYVNDNIYFRVKIFNYNSDLFIRQLKDRNILFTMSGLEPTEHIDLIYNQDENIFKGSGFLKFKFAGNYSFQTGYDSNDKITPSLGLFSSNLTIPILPTLQKYQVELNDRLFFQSKLILVLTIVTLTLTLMQLFNMRNKANKRDKA